MREKLVIVTTVNKEINKARSTGKLNLNVVALLNVLMYYIEYTQVQINNGFTEYVEYNKILKDKFYNIMYKCPEICNYKVALDFHDTINTGNNINHAPTVESRERIYTDTYTFVYGDFTNNFNDIDQGDIPKYVKILELGTPGDILTFNGVQVTSFPFTFNISEVSNLTFTPDLLLNTNSAGLKFRVSDNNFYPLYSNEAKVYFDITGLQANQPAITGDNTITVAHNVVTVLTLAMFTEQTAPPYSDPENDLIDAIKITSINSTNQGIFKVGNDPITVGQIISREQLQAGQFTHTGADVDTISSDTIGFEVRDEGSGIWVS